MSDFIIFNEESQAALKQGVMKITKAISTTMGPKGKLVLIERMGKAPHLTKDGATVAKSINLADRVESLGAQLLKQASENTATTAGDGSTTAAVLAAEIYLKASQALQSGITSPSEMCSMLTKKSKEIQEFLSKKAIQVSSKEEIKQVASISANGDEYIGELISNAMEQVKSSGLVTVEKSGSTTTTLNLVRGVNIDRGFISHYFINNQEKSKCILEDPYILIIGEKISNLTQILPILEKVHQGGKPLFIIANDYDHETIQSMVANVTKGLLQLCAIKSPFYGEKRNLILNDLAKALGTKVINDFDEKSIDKINLSKLGKCKKIEVTHNSTMFVECSQIQDSDELAKEIERLLEDKSLPKEEEVYLKQRLAINKGIVAVLSVGANTETSLLELVDRIDDALHATKAAIEGGFLPGGGISLAKAGLKLQKDSSSNQSLIEKNINKIMGDACVAPFRNILTNADLSVDYIFEMIKNSPDWEYGYDVRNEKYVNMIESGIIDPYKVTITALENATSVANSLLSIGCVVLQSEQYEQQDVQMVQLSDDMY